MTDKQIIDGVDVSGCEFYFYREGDEYPHRCSRYKDMYGCSITCSKNCLYKRLARKEQECEGLKNSSDEWMSRCEQETKLREFIGEQLDQLEAELKQEKALKEMYFSYYKAKHSDIKGKLFRYKQALADIKEIAEIKQKQSVFVSETVFEQILQLISEVEDDRQD